MKRRDFLKSALATGGVLGWGPRFLHGRPANDAPGDPAVKRVLVMFKCHFDLGFIDTQEAIIRRYFTKHFPEPLRIAETIREVSEDCYVWTTKPTICLIFGIPGDITRGQSVGLEVG
jgi:hypothetical protein